MSTVNKVGFADIPKFLREARKLGVWGTFWRFYYLGTFKFDSELVGTDEFGNKYFQTK